MHSVGKPRDVGSCVQPRAPSSFFSTAVKPPMSSLPSSSARLKALSLASAEAYLTTPLGAPCRGVASHPSISQDLDLSIASLSRLFRMLAETPHREASEWASCHSVVWPGTLYKQLRLSLWQTWCKQRGPQLNAGWSRGTDPGELDKADAPGVTSGEALLDIAVVQVVLCRAQVEAQQQALLELGLFLCFRLRPCIGKPVLRSGCCIPTACSAPLLTETLLHSF